jgi:cyclopropane-fatty-acyl-phospholipid synthase
MNVIDRLLEKDRLPDALIRVGIRRLLRVRKAQCYERDAEAQQERQRAFLAAMAKAPIALNTAESKEQHYEVPTRFYQLSLGRNLKYSSAYWGPDDRTLDQAEETMLALTARRAGISNGDKVLELGCGWGSLTLYLAKKFPKSKITGVSHSRTQRAYILGQAQLRGLKNVRIITQDMNRFDIKEKFDRAVSVEMFEHMRNWQALFGKLSRWLKPGGSFFMHVFTHRTASYLFETEGADDWMGRHFFTGGMMPGDALALEACAPLVPKEHWVVGGTHYGRTAEAWLANMDAHKPEILELFRETYGPDQALKWWAYWRVFYMACAELWNYDKGNEWFVSHYLFENPKK